MPPMLNYKPVSLMSEKFTLVQTEWKDTSIKLLHRERKRKEKVDWGGG